MIPETHLDLLAAPLTAIVTSIGVDGFPQSSAIWYVWEDNRLWFSTKGHATKIRNIRGRPQVSIVIVDPTNQFRYIEIRGTATVDEDPGCTGRDQVRVKYAMKVSAPDPFADDRVLVTINPVRVVVH